MAYIELVIKIPEEKYNYVKKQVAEGIDNPLKVYIANGTPLPKGHGKLKDADAFQKYCFNKHFDNRLTAEGLAIINMFLEFQPTIIEADKEYEA